MVDFFNHFSAIYKEYAAVINIIAGIIIFVLFFLLRKPVAKGISNLVSKVLTHRHPQNQEKVKSTLLRPVTALFMSCGIFIALMMNIAGSVVIKAFKIAVILIVCWGIINYLSENLFNILHISDNKDDKVNVTAVRFITNILKVLLVALAVVMVISELGYNISGLITGIGVGGLAISLAAQDAVSNLISGFIIITEKPFKVGDFVKVNEVVGTVDDVAMRSVKIRTLDDCLVTLPNSSITNAPITNYSKITHRLIDMEIGLVYATSNELLQKCQAEIKNYLLSEEEIVPSPVRVEFAALEDSALTLRIFCYTCTSDIGEYQRILSKVNYQIKKIIEENGASFAFPSTSVYLEKMNQ